jgi:hypothetical protein
MDGIELSFETREDSSRDIGSESSTSIVSAQRILSIHAAPIALRGTGKGDETLRI